MKKVFFFFFTKIRSDHGGEFNSVAFENLVKIMVFIPTSLQGLLNKTVWLKKKNRTLQEFARSILNEYSLPKYFWAESVNTACYVSIKF